MQKWCKLIYIYLNYLIKSVYFCEEACYKLNEEEYYESEDYSDETDYDEEINIENDGDTI